MASLSGSIERIVFRNTDSGFCVVRLRATQNGKTRARLTASITGIMPEVHPGLMLHLEGTWETHPVHGRTFKVETFEEEMPTDVDEVERYLGSGIVRGIGPVTASRIVSIFGARSIAVLDQEPEQLVQVPGLTAKRVQAIRQAWEEQNELRGLAIFLQSNGISVTFARRILEKYGETAQRQIEEDPYLLAHDIQGIGFRTADALARGMGIPKDSHSRFVAGLRYTVSEATDEGHVFLHQHEMYQRAARTLQTQPELLTPALLDLARRKEAVLEDEVVYLTPFYRAETGVARVIQLIRGTPSSFALDRDFNAHQAVARAAESHGLQLAEGQLRAAAQALSEKVSVLTGGPGTGKTSTLRTVITALEGADISYCLCAPTGRAAKKVAETTSRPASTIHRLLEYQPVTGDFNYDQNCRLPFDFVIVDEVSMLDLLLFYHLLKALPDEAHLLLVGDADQLPAVGPGSVLRDLIDSGAIPTVTLTELFRQARGSQIIVAAHDVHRGIVPTMRDAAENDFYFVETASDQAALSAIKKLVGERIPRRFGLEPFDDIQILSPMHSGTVGVTLLNTELQELLNPARPDLDEITRGGRTFRVNDKVMQIRNNYDKDVYNGDGGRVISVDEPSQSAVVAFGMGLATVEVEYEASNLDELVLAYAISVHKAQGSEFPCVVMPVVTRHFMLLQRHLLYTAITRSKQLCVLVGSRKALSIAVNTDRREQRNSRLAQRLASPPEFAQLELG